MVIKADYFTSLGSILYSTITCNCNQTRTLSLNHLKHKMTKTYYLWLRYIIIIQYHSNHIVY